MPPGVVPRRMLAVAFGQRATVGEQVVHAGAEAADVGDVEHRTVERQVASDHRAIALAEGAEISAGGAKLVIQHAALCGGEITGHTQRTDGVAWCQMGTGGQHHVATDTAVTAQGGAAGDGNVAGNPCAGVGIIAAHHQLACLYRGAARVAVDAVQDQRAAAEFAQRAGAGNHPGVGAIGGLIECQRGVVGDVALQAAGIALQGAGTDGGTAAVGVGTGHRHRAVAEFAQSPAAGNRTGKRAVGGLVEDQRGVVGDVALHAAGVALQGAGADRGATVVGIGACQRQRGGAEFAQRAAAGNRTGKRYRCRPDRRPVRHCR